MGYFRNTDFSLLSAPPKPEGTDGDFVRGVKQSWQELQGTAAGAVGLAGAGLGIDRMKDWGLDVAQEKFAKSAAMGRPYDSLENIEGVGDAVDWTQRGLGYVGAQAIPAILSGGIGSVVGKKLVQKGIEELLKKGLTKEAEKLAVKAQLRGAAAGAAASSYPQAAGSIYPDMVAEGYDEPGRAAAFAVPVAALDIAPQFRAAKALLDPVQRSTLKGMRRVGLETAKQAGAEGATEGVQTAIERAAAYKDLNSADAWWEYANATALGALGGGVLGGGAELVLGRDPVDLTKPGGAPGTESSVPQPPPNSGPQLLALPPPPTSDDTFIAGPTGIRRAYRGEILQPERALPPPPEGMMAGPLGIARTPGEYINAELQARMERPLEAPVDPATAATHPGYAERTEPYQPLPAGPVQRPPLAKGQQQVIAAPTWKQVARRAFIGAKGRGKSIQTIMAADNPQAAAQLAREIAFESKSSAEVKALDSVHKMLTGQTFDQYDAADMERARALEAPPEIKSVVDEKANEAATSKLNDLPQPTQTAAEAGKYKKGKIEVAGIKMDIENPAGSVRRGVGEDGKAWESTLATHYGYVPGTVAADSTKDQKQGVDVVVKPGTLPEWTGQVFVVNQNKPDGTFDEHKVVFGAASADEARELYLSNYPQRWERRIRSIVPMDPKAFMVWAKDSGPSGPKAGALKLNRDITQGVKLQDPEKEWDEEYHTKPEEPRFKELSATHKERWAQAVEDGYANGELFDELVRATRAVKLSDEIKAKADKGDADLDGRGRGKRKAKKAKAVVEPAKEEPKVEAKPMRLFHGSPNDSIDTFKGVTFFTPNRAVAEEFAKGQLAGSAKTEATAPRVYEADVVLGNTLDMRTPEGKGAYAEVREVWNKTHPDDRLPPVASEGFLISKSGLPSFGYARTLLQAMPEYDSVIADEGSQGESYVVRDGAAQAKIIEAPKPEDLGELGTRQYSVGKKDLPEGAIVRLNLPHVPGGYEVTAVVGKEVYVDEYGRETENDGVSHKMVGVSYIVDGQQIKTRMHAAELQKNVKEVVGQGGDSARLNSIQKPSDALKPKGTTAKAVGDIVKKLTGERANWRVVTFKDLEEAEDFINKKRDEAGKFGRNIGLADYDGGPREKLKPGTQAWVEKGKAYFVLSEIRPGEELAVFLHEVGKHLGMESLLKKSDQDQLASQIRKWAAKNDGSLESVTAQKALERLALTGNEVQILQNQDGFWRVYNYDGKLVNGVMEKTEKAAIDKAEVITGGAVTEHQLELPAYFIEEAVKAGVNPTVVSYKTPMARFLRKIWALYKSILRKIGLNPEKLTAQDVVDLAYGAARGALATKWHGSPATKIRKFAPQNYRGTGEGRLPLNEDRSDYRDMIAWGTYLADRQGTAKSYKENLARGLVLGDGTVLDRDELLNEEDGDGAETYNPKLVAFEALDRNLRHGIGKARPDLAFDSAIREMKQEENDYDTIRDRRMELNDDEEAERNRVKAEEAARAVRYLQEWKALGPVKHNRGALYATDTTVADDEWLDWEKPFSQQSKKVQAALNKLDVNPAKWASLDTGRTMYDVLVDEHGGSQRVVSQLLDKHGIKGVRYLDNASRQGQVRKVRVIAAEVPYREIGATEARIGNYERLSGHLRHLPKFAQHDESVQRYVAELLLTMISRDGKMPAVGDVKQTIDQVAESETAVYSVPAKAVKAANYEPILYALKHLRLEPAPKPTFNYVVFNGKNIVIARRNPNDRQDSQRQYSIAPAVAEIGKAVQVDNLGRLRRGILGLQFLRDLKDEFAAKLPAVKAFVDRVFDMSATANELIKKAGRTAKQWDALSDAQAQVLSGLQATATVMGIHPDAPLDGKDHLTATGLTISNKHLMQQDGTFSDDVKAGHAQLRAEWDKLLPQARSVYVNARDEMARNWNERERLLNKTIHKYFDPEIEKAKELKNAALVRSLTKERDDYLKEFGRLLSRVKGPYFPLSRFGDFFVVSKSAQYLEAEAKLKEANEKLRELYTKYNIPEEEASLVNSVNAVLEEHNMRPIKHLPDAAKKEIRAARKESSAARKVVRDLQGQEKHYINEAFESEAQARARAAELGVTVRLKEEYLRDVSSTSYAMINKIGDAIEGKLADKRVAMQAREAMMRVWLQSLPDTSALRHQLKRKNIAGFSKDMLRAFSQYSQRDAHYLSRLTHMDDIVDALFKLRRDTRGKGLEGEEVYNELARRYAASLDFVDTPVQDAISSLAFVFQLGISPAFLLTNLSQPFMISMPIMAAKHGLRAASSSLAKAWGETWKAAGTSFRDQRTLAFEIATGNFPADEQEMLQKVLKAGLLEITLEYDLGAIAEGGETRVKKWTRAMAIVPHQAEVVNRMATALAAYRMEVTKSGKDKAIDHAMDVLSRTHYDYSAANAPYFLKPGVVPMSKLIFQYRKYQLGTLTLLARQLGAAFKGQTPEARAEARRALAGLAVMHGAFAGAMGLPFVGTLTFVANVVAAAFGDDDQPFDAEVEMRNWFADILGKDAGAIAAKGLPMLLGADLSNKIGMGSIAAPIRVLRDNKEGRDLYLEALAALAGPAIGGLGPRFADGFKHMEDGNLIKAAEMFTPKFASDVIKGARLATEGQVTKGGNVAIKPEEISAWDAALSGLGIQPASLTERSAATAAVFDAKEDLKKRRGELERKYVRARMDGDSEAMSEVRAQIDAFNAKRKERGEPTIRTADLLNAYKQRRNYEKNRTEEGVSLNRREKALAQYGRFADTQ